MDCSNRKCRRTICWVLGVHVGMLAQAVGMAAKIADVYALVVGTVEEIVGMLDLAELRGPASHTTLAAAEAGCKTCWQ